MFHSARRHEECASALLRPLAFLSLLIVASAPMPALADCPTSPVNYNAQDCTIGSNTVCSNGTVTSFTCDVSWSLDDAMVTIVSDFDASPDYEAWGEANGELFCCESGVQYNESSVHIEGSYFADLLQFTWSGLTYNLNGVGGAITATIDGNDGPDTINGSHASTNITETLNGGAMGDTIRGNADADTLNGDAGDDLLLCGAGNDTANGGAGADDILGGAGTDTLYGDAGRDNMSGGDDDDYMNGGADGDTMCGEDQVLGDELHDGDTVDEGAGYRDVLAAGINSDEEYCLSTSTTWSGLAYTTNCTGPTSTSRPAACP